MSEELEVCYTLGRGGLRVPKSHVLVEFYGSIDEAMAMIGLARSFLTDERVQSDLRRIQVILHKIAASVYLGKSLVSSDDVVFLEEILRNYDDRDLKSFVIPSGPPGVTAIHVGRALVRRAERALCSIILGSQQEWMIQLGEVLNVMSQALFKIALDTCRRIEDCVIETLKKE